MHLRFRLILYWTILRLGYFSGIRHNREGGNGMADLILEVTDDLARSLEGSAAEHHKSIQELAIERLSSLVESIPEHRAGSAAAVLRAMQAPPTPERFGC